MIDPRLQVSKARQIIELIRNNRLTVALFHVENINDENLQLINDWCNKIIDMGYSPVLNEPLDDNIRSLRNRMHFIDSCTVKYVVMNIPTLKGLDDIILKPLSVCESKIHDANLIIFYEGEKGFHIKPILASTLVDNSTILDILHFNINESPIGIKTALFAMII